MKKLYLLLAVLLSALAVSCEGLRQEEAAKMAEEYVREHIAPLFDGAEITLPYIMPADGVVRFSDDHVKQTRVATQMANSRLDYLGRYAERVRSGDWDSVSSRLTSIKSAIMVSEVEAIEGANAKEGYYTVCVGLKHGENKREIFDVFLSKNLVILNAPIDTVGMF